MNSHLKEKLSQGGLKGGAKNKDNTILVAKEVARQVKNKELMNPTKAMIAVGYSVKTARSKVNEITKRPAYKRTLQSLLSEIKDKRDMALANITNKKLSKQQAITNAKTFDILNKNIQLMENKPTDLIGIGLLLDNLTKKEDN